MPPLSNFITSTLLHTALLRQTNPLWVAYFFVTDINPFDERLHEILSKYQDPRLVYTPIPQKYKIKVGLEVFILSVIIFPWCVSKLHSSNFALLITVYFLFF